jgi:hypothetical protein
VRVRASRVRDGGRVFFRRGEEAGKGRERETTSSRRSPRSVVVRVGARARRRSRRGGGARGAGAGPLGASRRRAHHCTTYAAPCDTADASASAPRGVRVARRVRVRGSAHAQLVPHAPTHVQPPRAGAADRAAAHGQVREHGHAARVQRLHDARRGGPIRPRAGALGDARRRDPRDLKAPVRPLRAGPAEVIERSERDCEQRRGRIGRRRRKSLAEVVRHVSKGRSTRVSRVFVGIPMGFSIENMSAGYILFTGRPFEKRM